MELLTLKPKHTTGTVDIEVVALDDSGVSIACTAQLTPDLSDIHALAWEEKAIVTEELLAFVRSGVRDYIKANQSTLADLAK
jgi:hypothetical protein